LSFCRRSGVVGKRPAGIVEMHCCHVVLSTDISMPSRFESMYCHVHWTYLGRQLQKSLRQSQGMLETEAQLAQVCHLCLQAQCIFLRPEGRLCMILCCKMNLLVRYTASNNAPFFFFFPTWQAVHHLLSQSKNFGNCRVMSVVCSGLLSVLSVLCGHGTCSFTV